LLQLFVYTFKECSYLFFLSIFTYSKIENENGIFSTKQPLKYQFNTFVDPLSSCWLPVIVKHLDFLSLLFSSKAT